MADSSGRLDERLDSLAGDALVQRELFQPQPDLADPAPARGWPERAPEPAPHVSMPLGEYRVKRLPGAPLPGTQDPTVTTEHIACKQPLQPVQAELVG